MTFVLSQQPNKPNRLSVGDKYKSKDSKYHLDYAKFALTASQTASYNKWLKNVKTNKNFYKGDQWCFDEDIQTFLNDTDSGNAKNRIKIVHNTIRPMVEQYRGNASILKINATAKSVSKLAINRRDMLLSQKIFKTRIAQEYPGLGFIMKKNDDSIGKDEQETTQIFENLYVDMYVSQINALLKYVSNLNQFEKSQMRIALNLALTGLVVTEAFEHGGHLRFRTLESEDFIWDQDAREPDLSDASFMGYMNPMDVSMVLEMWQPSDLDAKALETFVSSAGSTDVYTDSASQRTYSSTRVPVYKIFWKDLEKEEYGYVMDENNYPYLTRINYTYPGEDSPRYTDEDLIDPPDNSTNRKKFKGKKKTNLYFDCIRYCVFIPGESIAKAQPQTDERKDWDIILDYGLEYYQETDMMDISNAKFPLKCQTWGYVDGEIFSPVDDAINPQRFINRVLSVSEQLINNSGGSNVIIDEDAIDPNSDSDVFHDIKEGKPTSVRSRGKGIQNVVFNYDNTPKAGVYNMFGIIPIIKQMIQDTTGVNEALRGESTGSDQLVGVTQLLIQRGSLMQEPFYAAITDLYIQMYQYIATCGKRMYIDNKRELSIITGDEGVEILELSKDLKNEDFRVFVSRENDDAILKSQANQMLTIFLQMQLIDDKVFSNLYNRATPDDVTMALRSQAGLRIEAARRQANEAKQAEEKAISEAEFLQERDRQDKINAQNQQERIADKQMASKENMQINDMLIKDELRGNI